MAVLVIEQTPDQRFPVGAFLVGLAPGTAEPAEIVQHQIGVVVD